MVREGEGLLRAITAGFFPHLCIYQQVPGCRNAFGRESLTFTADKCVGRLSWLPFTESLETCRWQMLPQRERAPGHPGMWPRSLHAALIQIVCEAKWLTVDMLIRHLDGADSMFSLLWWIFVSVFFWSRCAACYMISDGNFTLFFIPVTKIQASNMPLCFSHVFRTKKSYQEKLTVIKRRVKSLYMSKSVVTCSYF